ncbi:MAG: DUF2325 domain-containing protein [Gammaproteobacteria bacterium]|nr:MAG: DUF2325 domain-containing protein [Gammaproteobacteria bacterium]
MMKFLKKPALVTASGTIPRHHFTDSESTDTFFSCYLRNITKLLRAWKQRRDCPNLNRAISNKSIPVIDWAPLVKATSSPEVDSNSNRTNHQNNTHYRLSGRSVLCVGGRIKLYPEYNRLIKNCDGCFMAFHGSSHDNFEDLLRFLKRADMIICPVDCVNHEAFFTVKHYCKDSGKPCVLLEHSEIKNFKAGIRMLAGMSVSQDNQYHTEK